MVKFFKLVNLRYYIKGMVGHELNFILKFINMELVIKLYKELMEWIGFFPPRNWYKPHAIYLGLSFNLLPNTNVTVFGANIH